MLYNYSKLRGAIREVYGTQDAFAKAMKMGTSTLSAKLTNKSEWTQEEIREALELLNISPEFVNAYFFTKNIQII